MSKEEVARIIFDYEQYFKQCKEDGFEESRIVSMLGSPKGIAEEFLDYKIENLNDSTVNDKSYLEKIKSLLYVKLNNLRRNGSKKKLNIFNKMFMTLFLISSALIILLNVIIGLSILCFILYTLYYVPELFMTFSLNPILKVFLIFCIAGFVFFESLVCISFKKLIHRERYLFKFCTDIIITNKMYINK